MPEAAPHIERALRRSIAHTVDRWLPMRPLDDGVIASGAFEYDFMYDQVTYRLKQTWEAAYIGRRKVTR